MMTTNKASDLTRGLNDRTSGLFHVRVGKISAYYHWSCPYETRLIQDYVIQFVRDLRQIGGFLRSLRFPSPIKLT
jgi:hypothetical protein